MYIYQVRLFNSRCSYETTLIAGPIVRDSLPESPCQHALFVRDNLKLGRLPVYTYPIRLVNSRCLYEMTFKVELIDRVYLPDSPSQLALFARIFLGWGIVHV